MNLPIQNYISNSYKLLNEKLDEDESFLFNSFISVIEWQFQILKNKSFLGLIIWRVRLITTFLIRILEKPIFINFELINAEIIFLPRSKTHFAIHYDIYKDIPQSYFLFSNYIPGNNFNVKAIEYNMKFGRFLKLNELSLAIFKILCKTLQIPSYKEKNRKYYFFDLFLGSYIYGKKQFNETLAICNCLKKINPKVILVGNDFTIAGRTVALFFRNTQVKTACVQHGTLTDLQIKSLVVDKFYVYGKNDYNRAINIGIDQRKLHIAGSKKIDNLLVFKPCELTVKSALNLKDDNTLILVLFSKVGHTVSEEHQSKLIELVSNAAKHFPKYYFVFKLHPRDNIIYYNNVRNQKNIHVFEDSNSLNLSLEHWINESDIVVTGASTAALEAILFKKPVITIDIFNELPKYSFIANGITFHVRNLAEFIVAVCSIQVKNEKYNTFLNKVDDYLVAEFGNYKNKSNSAGVISNDILKELFNNKFSIQN